MPNIKPYFNLDVQQDGVPEASGVVSINFISPLVVTDLGGGNVSVSGGGGSPTGTPNSVAFFDALGNLNDSAAFTYNDANEILTCGTGNLPAAKTNSFLFGNNNDASLGAGQNVVMFGQSNLTPLAFASTIVFAAGSQNTISGIYSAVFGVLNDISGDSSFAAGQGNSIGNSTTKCFAFGLDNAITGSADYCFAAGRGLTTTFQDQFLCGTFNDPDTNDAFQVGNGTSLVAQSNAFAVTKAGNAKHERGIELRTAHAGAKAGTAVLVAGTVTIATTQVTANSMIFVTAQDTGAGPGALYISARNAGVDFTITSTSGADTSTVAWMIVEPFAAW